MDTNLNIPAHKKVVSVEVLHLDEPGYGPQGQLEFWIFQIMEKVQMRLLAGCLGKVMSLDGCDS
jgi:hypothetical protein